jgi:WD40 repeat protein
MHHVFISYSRKQTRQVSTVVSLLEADGVSVWMDRSDIPEGVPWELQLRRAVREADLVAYFVSDDWKRSQACASERDLVREFSKPALVIELVDDHFDANSAAHTIETTLAGLGPKVAIQTDLESAAAAWAEQGHRRKLLARGRELTKFRTVRRQQTATATAAEYLTASVRAHRLHILDAILGMVVIGLCLAFIRAAPTAIDNANKARADSLSSLSQYAAITIAQANGPYAILDAALTVPADDEKTLTSGTYTMMAINALQLDIPIDNGDTADTRFASWVFPEAGTQQQSDNGTLLARVSDDQTRVVISNVADRDTLLADVTVFGAPIALAFSPDGRILATLSHQAITLVDPIRGIVWRTLDGADLSQADSLAWSADGRQIAASRSTTHTITVWPVLTETQILGDTGLWIMDSTTLGTTGKVAFLGRDGSVAVVDPTATPAVRLLTDVLPGGIATDVAANSTGTTIYIIVQAQGTFGLYNLDMTTNTSRRIALPDDCAPTSVATNPSDDSMIYMACDARIIEVRPNGEVATQTTTDIASISALTVSNNGVVLAGAAGGGGVFPYNADLSPEKISYTNPMADSPISACAGATPQDIAIRPDSEEAYIATDGTGFDMCARTLSLTGTTTWHMDIPPISVPSASQSRAVAAAPDGSVAAFGLSDGSVQILRAGDGLPGWRWNEQYGEIRGVQFTPDSKNVIIGTRDGLITMVPTYADRMDGATLRSLAQQMLDRAKQLGLYNG